MRVYRDVAREWSGMQVIWVCPVCGSMDCVIHLSQSSNPLDFTKTGRGEPARVMKKIGEGTLYVWETERFCRV